MPGAALRGVGALVGAPLRVAGRRVGWSAAPDSSPKRYSERRSEIFRNANALLERVQQFFKKFFSWTQWPFSKGQQSCFKAVTRGAFSSAVSSSSSKEEVSVWWDVCDDFGVTILSRNVKRNLSLVCHELASLRVRAQRSTTEPQCQVIRNDPNQSNWITDTS